MQLLCMRRAVVVYEGLIVQSDGVDHKRIALVMANQLAVPGRLHIGRMRHVEIDPANLRVARKDHRHLLGRLHEVDRLDDGHHEGRNA